ncbi:hypothetical protein EV702DRAFT_1047077 [Suillus placidus]|uniref:Uncharacterized protein n=1 Tax=Suillus placidus TaxID=48579 RepID=A0A9P6ZS08_9AGAM|nr:hypothetical protein EV702DRAFT_1047077 [Suillus placidus]
MEAKSERPWKQEESAANGPGEDGRKVNLKWILTTTFLESLKPVNVMEVFALFSEVKFVWTSQWSWMTYLYLAVRYFGLFLAMLTQTLGFAPALTSTRGRYNVHPRTGYGLAVLLEWGFSIYFWLAEVSLIWRLYALYNQSKFILYVLIGLFLIIVALSIGFDIFLYSRPEAFSVKEIVTPRVNYCTTSFNIGPMPAIYASIPIICYDIFLVVLAVLALARHLRERKEMQMKPNTYVILIVRCHIVYFLLNLTNQVLLVVLWANIPPAAMSLSEGFINTAPFIIAPRLIISIWDTHANDEMKDKIWVEVVEALGLWSWQVL